MSDSYNTRIKLKRDTEANWTSLDPVLLDGEVAIVRMPDGNTRKKIGDGAKKFSELPYDDANVTKDAVVSALGFTPISADQVPVKKVNGETGDVKSTYFVTVTPTGSGHNATADKTAMEVYAAHEAGYAVYAFVQFEDVPFKLPLVAAAIADGVPLLGFGALGSINEHEAPQYPTVAYNGLSWQAWIGTLVPTSDIDNSLSDSSINPVQNNVVKAALDNKANIDSPTFTSKMTLKASNGGKVECVNASYMDEKGGEFAGIQLSSQEGNSTGLVAIGGIKTPDPNTDGSTDTAVSVEYLHEQLLFKADNTIVDKDRNKAGLMSASDKIKLDGIATGANKTIVDTALSDSSTNPVQNKVVKKAIDDKADKTALNSKLDKTGGTLTGNLSGQYIAGTWLQTTDASDFGKTAGKIAVLDESGWVYYRTASEILNDIGAASISYVDSAITQAINNAY